MGMELFNTRMELIIKENGKMTNKKGMVWNNGKMELNMKDIKFKEKNMEAEYYIMQMDMCMKVNSSKMRSKELESINGQMGNRMMVNGI